MVAEVLRDDAGVAVPVHRALGDGAGADALVVAPGEQRRARRRADRGGVEGVVADALVRDARQRRRVDRAAEGVGQAEADVVEQDDEDVGRVLRQMARLRRRWCLESCKVGPATLAEARAGTARTEPSAAAPRLRIAGLPSPPAPSLPRLLSTLGVAIGRSCGPLFVQASAVLRWDQRSDRSADNESHASRLSRDRDPRRRPGSRRQAVIRPVEAEIEVVSIWRRRQPVGSLAKSYLRAHRVGCRWSASHRRPVSIPGVRSPME